MCELCTNGLYPGWDVKTGLTVMQSTGTPGWTFEYSEWKEEGDVYSKEIISRFKFPDDFVVYFKILWGNIYR